VPITVDLSQNRPTQTALDSTQTQHLCQKQLARRWRLSHRTLERWRSEGTGPRFLKINGRCLYRLEDVEAFERDHLHKRAAEAR
jgi:hypothetical protein